MLNAKLRLKFFTSFGTYLIFEDDSPDINKPFSYDVLLAKYDFIGLKKIGVTRQGIFDLKYFMFIEAIYVVLQVIYYLFAKWMYIGEINRWND